MLKWLKSLFSMPKPAGPPRTIRTFSVTEPSITRDGVRVDGDSLRIDSTGTRTVRLFDVQDPGVQQCIVTYRAEMKAEKLEGRAYLEMWCGFPGRGEFFSKGFDQALSGTADWGRYEIPFYLKRGQTPELIKLNLVVEGRGVVWLRKVELLQTPLAS
jgi:hypothetical protein